MARERDLAITECVVSQFHIQRSRDCRFRGLVIPDSAIPRFQIARFRNLKLREFTMSRFHAIVIEFAISLLGLDPPTRTRGGDRGGRGEETEQGEGARGGGGRGKRPPTPITAGGLCGIITLGCGKKLYRHHYVPMQCLE